MNVSMEDYYRLRAPVYDTSMGYDRSEVVHGLQPVIDFVCEQVRDLIVLEIACGPCFWTNFVAKSAKFVVATDYNLSTLNEARKKNLDWTRIALKEADAYRLPDFERRFDAALGMDWFAHVPISRRNFFLDGLHARLNPGAVVLFCDQTPRESSWTGKYDEEGNHLQVRELSDKSRHLVIKNFLTAEEASQIFMPYTDQIIFKHFPLQYRSIVVYRV